MSIKLSGSNDSEKLASLCQQTYKNQAIWFLNAFWDQFQAEAPKLWKIVGQCADLDAQRHGDGNGLDEVQAHRLLELLGETLTVVALRERLRKTGAIGQAERPKIVPLTHYILWRYEVDWHVLVNTTGDNSEEIAKAQQLLDQVSAAFQEADRQAQLSRQAEAHAKSEEAQAISKENYAREQEAPFKAAQEEVDAALADVNAQESARDSRTAELQRKSTEGGIVQQNKAKAELAQHLAEDPLPLRKAKITLEAALKRAEKARAPFEAATKVAEAARQVAEAARHEAEAARREAESARQVAEAARQEAAAAREQAEAARRQAESARQAAEAARRAAEESRRAAEAQRQAAEEALDEAGRKVEEAEAYLAEVKAKPGKCHGAIWWMEKELEEQKKYLPSSKGGVAKRG